ncbi:MAG: undecaprenyl-diphosphate phosphatase, partial [candidate division KSB1 bacterium]|nr:undecaprenyl-diphosphate phosphatase [candidate division KSB1 bacterium]
MNDFLIAVILGIVEGLTEFLPISSTGHLILVASWLHFTGDKANAFTIFIQLGAIVAVVGYFRQRLLRIALAMFGKPRIENPHGLAPVQARGFFVAVLIAFLPSAILGLLLGERILSLLFKPQPVALALIAGGAAILLVERFRPAAHTTVAETLSWRQALWIGIAQCSALIPGMSRSAATILGGLLTRLNHTAAAEFSFFLAIPTLVAASLYELAKIATRLSGDEVMIFAVGFWVSMIVAWIVIAGFMAFIKRHSF